MKITCVSDLHWHEPRLGSGDLLIICGDSIEVDSLRDFSWRLSYLKSFDYEHIIYCAGNHDVFVGSVANELIHEMFNDRGITYLENESYEYKGKRIYACPYSPIIPGMDWPFTSNKLNVLYSNIPENLDILITHCPPRDILDVSMGNHYGSIELRDKVFEVKPKYHVFGHIHDSYGQCEIDGIKFINCSLLNDKYQVTNLPTEIEL